MSELQEAQCKTQGPVTFVCAAQALAINVFPVPGGPYNNTPKNTPTNSTI